MKVNTVNFLRHAHLYTNSNHIPIMGNKDKTRDGDATTENRDHSRDQEAARDAALARTIAKTLARETQSIAEVFARQMEKAHAQYQDLLKESHAAALPTTLKVTSGSDGFTIQLDSGQECLPEMATLVT